MTILGKGVGVLAKGIGSGSPSFVAEDRPDPEIIHPFKVTVYKSGENFVAKVRAGTVNNLVPKIGTDYLDASPQPSLTFTGTGYKDIVLEASVGDPPIFFPDTVTVQVKARGTYPDTDENGYLALASVNIVDGAIASFAQYVYASQVLMRVKPGSATALWNWNSR
jgi:hypothetical protein